MERLDVFDPSNISITSYHTDEQECTHCNREHTLVYVHTGRLDITEHTRTTTLRAGECAFMRRDNHRQLPHTGRPPLLISPTRISRRHCSLHVPCANKQKAYFFVRGSITAVGRIILRDAAARAHQHTYRQHTGTCRIGKRLHGYVSRHRLTVYSDDTGCVRAEQNIKKSLLRFASAPDFSYICTYHHLIQPQTK